MSIPVMEAHSGAFSSVPVIIRTRYRGQQPAGPAGGGATLVVLVRCSMSCNRQLWRPGEISPLLFFNKIHYGIMSIDKDKYLIPSQNL